MATLMPKAKEMKTESIFVYTVVCRFKLRLFERFRDDVSSISDFVLQTFEIVTKIEMDSHIFNNL